MNPCLIKQLDKVVCRVATVHQQHSIKGFLALQDLIAPLLLTDSEVEQLSQILAFEPITPLRPLDMSEAMAFPKRRWQWLLRRGVIPASYYVLKQWIDEEGFDTVIAHYVERACEINGYLGHHLTVLLAFARIWQQLDAQQQLRLIERLAEFIGTTFDRPHNEEPLKPGYQAAPDRAQLIADVIRHPGFLAHNWITLAVLLREDRWLTEPQRQHGLALLHQRCFWQFDDPRDEPKLALAPPQDVSQLCRSLLLDSCTDLHQLTIADAAMWLHKHASLDEPSQRWLEAGLRHVIANM